MPCRSKSIVFKAFALTGRLFTTSYYPGCYPGLGASALSGRIAAMLFSDVNNLFTIAIRLTFRCNMWMLLIVKLLSFKRYNYPFYKCRENEQQMQCAYSQPVSDKVVPLLFSLFCKILETNAMHCFSASSVSCVTERLSGCKDTDLYWIRANYYLKKYYSTVAFFDNFNRTTSCITVNELQTMGNVNMVYII